MILQTIHDEIKLIANVNFINLIKRSRDLRSTTSARRTFGFARTKNAKEDLAGALWLSAMVFRFVRSRIFQFKINVVGRRETTKLVDCRVRVSYCSNGVVVLVSRLRRPIFVTNDENPIDSHLRIRRRYGFVGMTVAVVTNNFHVESPVLLVFFSLQKRK